MKKYIKSSKGVDSMASEIVSTLYNEHPEIDYIGDAKTKSGDMVLQFDIKKMPYEDFKDIINSLFSKYKDRLGFGTSQYRDAPEIRHPSILIKKAAKKVESATNTTGIPAKVSVESAIEETDDTVWIVYGVSEDGDRRIIVVVETDEDAMEFCEEHNWEYEEDGVLWTLEYDWDYRSTIEDDANWETDRFENPD